MSSKQKEKLIKSNTENIALVNPNLENSKEVNLYIKELEQLLVTIGLNDPYYAWYLCTTFGKKADTIIEKINSFNDGTPEEKLIRAELWYCINYEMTNSMGDFFVRRTSRLYFNIESVLKFKDLILKDFITYLEWDEKRIASEQIEMQLLLDDATIFYDTEFE